MPTFRLIFAVTLALGFASRLTAEEDLFEKRIRPLLVEHCYKCHSDQGKAPKGGLRVDSRVSLLKGGDGGPAIVPGEAAKSKLIEAVKYGNPDLLMPPKGKLPASAIADLEAWIKAGAVWPNDSATTRPTKGSTFDLQARKQAHWSWQPMRPQTPPTVKNASWASDPIDQFLLAKLEAKNLTPAAQADKPTWLRRVTFAVTGLPPTPDEIAAFQKDDSPQAHAKVVDRLLASPGYGERWGRHWLDLVRFAETRGHEFEPEIPNAYQYRDYVIRALNADVPYTQFVKEHVAGDVLTEPRLDTKSGANESLIGPAFWHLGEEVHSPVDVRQDQADRLDNRIDVFSKTFLGLTVSCARCHDHKFDAISTKDFYALYGLLEGSSFRLARFDGWKQNQEVAAVLAKVRTETSTRLKSTAKAISPPSDLPTRMQHHKLDKAWRERAKVVIDYAIAKPEEWLPDDVTFGPGPRLGGRLSLTKRNGQPAAIEEMFTAAVFDPFWADLKLAPNTSKDFGALGRTTRAGFTIRTPEFVIERENLYYLVRGGGTAYAGVCGHTVIAGPLHGGLMMGFPDNGSYRWVAHRVAGYKGQRAHVELTADPKTPFAVAAVMQADEPPPFVFRAGFPSHSADPDTLKAVAEEVAAKEKELAAKVVWESRLAPTLHDGTPVDESVFVRGNPRTPGEVVPHRFLEALAGPQTLPHKGGSGRLELANQLTDPTLNPYLARVAVNRIWHHLFGRGIVASTDNFGVLGEAPTHPELLDYLATEFVRDGWSLKRFIRRLTLTSAYRMSSEGPMTEADPSNVLLAHFRMKRLEGEAIRDAMLSVSGRLDRTAGGPSMLIYLTPFLEGRGRPGSGPLDGAGRRSVYLAVRRNFLNPFLVAFDTPIPFSTVGRRQVSNVPAQALILLNDPFVQQQASEWAKRAMNASGSVDEKVKGMFVSAFGRAATETELAECRTFVSGKETDATAWADLAHALFNVKEFVFVK